VRVLRRAAATLLAKGNISRGWYAILTAGALLVVAHLLSTVADTDPAAPYVAGGLVVLALQQLWRGVTSEYAERSGRASLVDPSAE
jgi:hypothetical protein